ncbi:MAG: hypothetical protein H0V44_13835 [Planctomycetes bacterium]|nr:hypothetical protein [Planctomycetota bacterium]
MADTLKIPEGTSPPERTRRNMGMATVLVLIGLVFGVVGVAVLTWTPMVLIMSPVFFLSAGGYAIMGRSSKDQGHR